MKSPIFRLGTLGLLLAALSTLVGCKLDTRPKNLGSRTTATDTSATTDVDVFSVALAYRPTGSRLVTIQGVRGLPSAKLSVPCGTNGTGCHCLYYRNTADTAPISSAGVGLSDGVNSYSCTMAGSLSPDLFSYVRLVNNLGTAGSGFVNIKSSLTITDVIGDLAPNRVRGIYRYACQRYFLEGEGIQGDTANCVANQKLGLITAPYNFYLYSAREASTAGDTKDQAANIISLKSSGAVFPELICNRQLTKVACPTSPELRYGLYAEQSGPFTIGLTMTTKPEASGTNDTTVNMIMGYAALPDTAGNCPTGLIKIRPWTASPQSIIARSIDGANPPSNFLNNGNALNSTVVEESQPSAMQVSRQPNSTPCSSTSDCSAATFGGLSVVQSVNFAQLSPVVCAIPSTLLPGVIP